MMAKVVYASLRPSGSGKMGGSVTAKRVKTPDGKTLVVHTVDADSRTFDDDMSYVFRRNVERARRQHKRTIGSGNRVPAED